MEENNQNELKSEKLSVEEKIIAALRTVYDPEIPVNVYDLGLVYKIDYHEEDGTLDVDMTLTAPGCPLADYITEDVRQKISAIEGVTSANVNLVFEPEWDQSMMSEEAKVDLGLF
ncbi:MAG: iron-sulfur cluster assembly protein [Bacteroidaceae bacterium]|jgi:FeS assembly SUF system protein|nr:iron-sulfur cluster assembly protein [Bacteroidaceae bacterium]